ncbi:DUF262 domain-containing protein [Empedobacter falsenii]
MKNIGLKEYSIEDILLHYNLIVPEIQREYVWGLNAHKIIDTFLEDIKECRKNIVKADSSAEIDVVRSMLENPLLDDQAKSALEKLLTSNESAISSELNIGFLYSYRPPYSDGSKDRDLFLIDGQQRFTTLFLLLFYFAIKEKRMDTFVDLFKINIAKGTLGFDYRVRSLTHQFFVELLDKTKTVADLLSVRKQTWFLNNFSKDVTVNAICGTEERPSVFDLFNRYFEKDDETYFDYIKSKIKFWHFKTEETSQGEELYITMNSRGQQLADNENIRAKLFDSEEVKSDPLYWSEKWEQWQDFFWKNRDKSNGHSADEGFNEFLRWNQLLIMINYNFENSEIDLEKEIKFLQNSVTNLEIKYLNLETISLYFDALKYLQQFFEKENIDSLLTDYPKYKAKFNFTLFTYINGNFLNQSQLFLILPLLEYCKQRLENKKEIRQISLFRIFKFITNLLEDITITKSIRDQIINIVEHIKLLDLDEDITSLLKKEKTSKTILNEEQVCKLNLYLENTNERIQYEDSFWYAETLQYIKGNLLHIIEYLHNKNNIFNISLFDKYIVSFKYFLLNENNLWGELIPTDVYYYDGEKIMYSWLFYKKGGFLNLINDLMVDNNLSIKEFKDKREKGWFTNNYSNFQTLENESDKKNQLYIIYILKTHQFFKLAKWDWSDDRFNFGVWPDYPSCNTVFNNGFIYQMIKSNFVDNRSFIFDFHYKKLTSENVFDKLVEWAKN